MTVRILQGDCRELLRTLPDESVNCCVTSPPYWSLRDYGTEPLDWPAITYAPLAGLDHQVTVEPMRCSLGLEPSTDAFIGHMVAIFREVRRVLRADGTLWMNMGDSYAGSRSTPGDWVSDSLNGKQPDHSGKAKRIMTASRRRDDEQIPRSDIRVWGLKSKDMVAQPWRLALALQADGWWLRRDIIWHKKNPMPESCGDRPTTSHEYLFLLSKSERYYYDAEAIKEPCSPDTHLRYARGRSSTHKHAEASLIPGGNPQTISQSFEHMRRPVKGWAQGPGTHSAIDHARDPGGSNGAYADGKSERLGRGPGWRKSNGVGFGHGYDANPKPRVKQNLSFEAAVSGEILDRRNKRSVWTIATEPFKEAHFATFPTALVEPCILAGCPEGGTVVDIFGGSGTTGLVADRNQRNAILMELNPTYAEMSRKRIYNDAPLLSNVV